MLAFVGCDSAPVEMSELLTKGLLASWTAGSAPDVDPTYLDNAIAAGTAEALIDYLDRAAASR
jgi:hypothetical protein